MVCHKKSWLILSKRAMPISILLSDFNLNPMPELTLKTVIGQTAVI
jgi:hypothetical protein